MNGTGLCKSRRDDFDFTLFNYVKVELNVFSVIILILV